MPKRCVAAGCNNTVENGVSVYTFPKDEALKKKWIDQVKRTRDCWTGATVNSVLCSEHFTEDSFEESYNLHQSFGLKKYKRLKKGAVPTIFKRKAEENVGSVPVSKRPRSAYKKREQKRVSQKNLSLEMIQISLDYSKLDDKRQHRARCPHGHNHCFFRYL